jgi:hypothetical protein
MNKSDAFVYENYTFLIVFKLNKLSHYVNPQRNKQPE